MKRFLCLFLILFLSGCAIGRKTSYLGVGNFRAAYTLPVVTTIGVLDHRPYVLSGLKKPAYCGLIRSYTGIPYSMTTRSGKPLAFEMTMSISETLRTRNGADVRAVTLSETMSEDQAVDTLTRDEGKSLLFILKDWQHDVYTRGKLIHHVKVLAIGPAGVLAETEKAGETEIDRKNPLRQAVAKALWDVINAPEIFGVMAPTD